MTTEAEVEDLSARLATAEEALGEISRITHETLGSTCGFADDNIKVLAALAVWALQNGVPDSISPNIIPRAKAWLAGEEMARAKISPMESFVWKAHDMATLRQQLAAAEARAEKAEALLREVRIKLEPWMGGEDHGLKLRIDDALKEQENPNG